MNKFKLSEYVVYKGILCIVQTVWSEPKGKYGLQRVYPLTYMFADKVDEKELTKWEGII